MQVQDQDSSKGLARFGFFQVDLRTGELRKHGIRMRLQEQPFRVLQILLEHSGGIVSREELQRQIWPEDTFVDFERGLNNAVKRLREALADSADEPRYIETIPKRGYRFIADLEATPQADGNVVAIPLTPSAKIPSRAEGNRAFFDPRLGTAVFATVVILLGVSAVFLGNRILGTVASPGIQSLAVLPLQNLSGDPSQEYFADGMTDGLISELAQISSVRVISRTSVMRYKKTSKTLPEIARELHVDGIIEGTVQRSGGRVRITAQLLQAPAERHIWAGTYERDLQDVLWLERDLTQEIGRQIRAKLVPQAQPPPTQPRPVNLKAFEAYLQGKYHLDRVGQGFADEEADNAAEYFQQAITADPFFLRAYIGLLYAYDGRLLPSRENNAIAESARQKILELAPNSSIAAMVSARAKQNHWDWAGAEAEYRRATELDPNSVDAHSALAQFLDWLCRFDEGWKEWQAAQELNPNPDRLPSALDLPQALANRDKCEQAMPLLLRIAENNSNDGQTHLQLSSCYHKVGNYRGEIEELGKTAALYGYPEVEIRLKQAYAVNGHRAALRQWIRELEHLQSTKQLYMPAYLATVYGELDDREKVFYWLEEAYRSHISNGLGSDLLPWLKMDASLDLIRRDSRYFDLLGRVGLPAEPSRPATN
jgi:TolB-like protein/DNA-binding winged helix-turn-helix (wHTH) protein/tetratricopeptide (TPR) repeat protein